MNIETMYRLAHDGLYWLRVKWEGDYGKDHPAEIREQRITEITKQLEDLKQFRKNGFKT